MKNKITLVFLGMLLAFAGYTQNTGYMGKHFIISMDASFSPAYSRPNFYEHSVVDNADYFAFNCFLNPTIEAIVWKKGSVGLGYNHFSSYYNAEIYLTDDVFSTLDYNFLYHLKSHGFTLFYKQYVGDNIAPLGHYFKFYVDGLFFNYQFTDELSQEIIDLGYDTDSRFSRTPHNGNLFGVKVEYGYDFLFWDCLKISSGLSIGTTFGGYKETFFSDFSDVFSSNRTEPLEYAKTRILGAYWIGMKLGIGLLTI